MVGIGFGVLACDLTNPTNPDSLEAELPTYSLLGSGCPSIFEDACCEFTSCSCSPITAYDWFTQIEGAVWDFDIGGEYYDEEFGDCYDGAMGAEQAIYWEERGLWVDDWGDCTPGYGAHVADPEWESNGWLLLSSGMSLEDLKKTAFHEGWSYMNNCHPIYNSECHDDPFLTEMEGACYDGHPWPQ